MQTAKVKAGNLTLELPIVPLPDAPISILLFDSFGNTKLIHDVAKEVVSNFKKPDIIVCPEAKAIPLSQEIARQWDIDYFVLRKNKKLYMSKPKHIITKSITTEGEQQLWYDEAKLNLLQGKQVMLFDDVISTGGTLKSLLAFATECSLTISSIATIFVEGESPFVKDVKQQYTLESLGHIDILPKE